MKRDYTSGVKTDVEFFVGYEIEHTPAHGHRTLFVVGIQPVDKILENYKIYQCTHIYLGANQSFDYPSDQWYMMIYQLLSENILVTLDFDISKLEYVQSTSFCEHNNFIPQISVKIPNIKKLNYNATLKIDDIDFKATNPGVWCHRLHDLQAIDKFTGWHEYGKDETL